MIFSFGLIFIAGFSYALAGFCTPYMYKDCYQKSDFPRYASTWRDKNNNPVDGPCFLIGTDYYCARELRIRPWGQESELDFDLAICNITQCPDGTVNNGKDGQPPTFTITPPDGKCGSVLVSNVSDDLRRHIVMEHNKYRSLIANAKYRRLHNRTATNMMELSWDNDLGNIAQNWINRCKEIGGPEHQRERYFREFGENLYTSTDPDDKGNDAVNQWYQEIKNFTMMNNRAFNNLRKEFKTIYPAGYEGPPIGPSIKHFTALAWAKTSKVGCGFLKHKPEGESTTLTKLYCNYEVIGNLENQEIYEIGPVASKCPKGTVANNEGLCAKNILSVELT